MADMFEDNFTAPTPQQSENSEEAVKLEGIFPEITGTDFDGKKSEVSTANTGEKEYNFEEEFFNEGSQGSMASETNTNVIDLKSNDVSEKKIDVGKDETVLNETKTEQPVQIFSSNSVGNNIEHKPDVAPPTQNKPCEPESMIQWREERRKRIEEQDMEEEKKKAEWREAARKELENWYGRREEWLVKKKAENREANEEFLKIQKDENNRIGYIAQSSKVAKPDKGPGSEWHDVATLCDFSAKTRSSSDVSRMRSMLLQLRESNWVNPLAAKS